MNIRNTEHKKILIVVLILIILTAGLFFLRRERKKTLEEALKKETALTLEELPTPTIISEVLSGAYKIVFEKNTLKLGETVLADVVFTADNKIISGSDVILRFNPTFLSADQELKAGDYFGGYPRKSVDNTKGVIKVVGFGGKNEPVSSPVTFFSVALTAKKLVFKDNRPITTTVDFDFIKGKTNLTTLVEKGTSKNILGQVVDGTITIEP